MKGENGMFNGLFVKEKTATELEIERVQRFRSECDPGSEEYAHYNWRLKELLELKELETKKVKKFEVSGDTVVKCICFVGLGALIVFKEELVGPIATKAVSLLTKMV